MNATRRVKLKDISDFAICSLCQGYIIDATTTIECLHSFCKTCIVKHLEGSEYCPACDVQLHSTRPLSGIRQDQMLQEIIYKLVPGLFSREMETRRKFYKEHPESHSISQLDAGQIFNQPYITSDDKISISLEYFTNDKDIREKSKRYFYCPAGVSISVLRKLVQGKHDLAKDAQIDIMYGERILPDDFLLMDVAYKYTWTDSMTKPLGLSYKFKEALPLVSKSPAKKASKRKARSFTDSEILKPSTNINSLDTRKLTPNGKVRGRKPKAKVLHDSNLIQSVEEKRKKLNNLEPITLGKSFKDTESQSLVAAQEVPQVQLRISETGVISAKSVVSGEERIIEKSPVESSKEKQDRIQQISSPSVSLQSFNYVQLNIPTVTGLFTSPSSSICSTKPEITALQRIHDLAHTPSPNMQPKPSSILPTTVSALEKKLGKTSKTDGSSNFYPNKEAHVKKALLDLQRKHLIAATEHMHNGKPSKDSTAATKHSADKLPTINGKSSPLNGLTSATMPSLPFPLSALASSGMTVNVIPSSEIKSNSSRQSKESATSTASPPPSKKPKLQTTVVNGILKFTASPKNGTPSPTKNSTQGGLTIEMASPKPRKFFKSRQNSDGESPKRQDKSESSTASAPTSTVKSSTSLKMANGGHTANPADLRLINSTNCKKTGTTTTPSRITVPTPITTTVPSVSAFPSAAVTQFSQQFLQLQYWSHLQNLAMMNGGSGATNGYFPFVTSDYISMPLQNRPSLPSTNTLNLSGLFTNGGFTSTNVHGNGIPAGTQNHSHTTSTNTSKETPSESIVSDFSVMKKNKKKDLKTALLDLSLKKLHKPENGITKNVVSERNTADVETPQVSSPSSQLTSTGNMDLEDNSVTCTEEPAVSFEAKESSNPTDLSTTFSNQKEVDENILANDEECQKSDQISDKVECASEPTVSNNEESNIPSKVEEIGQAEVIVSKLDETLPKLENGHFSPDSGESKDSTDLVISEDPILPSSDQAQSNPEENAKEDSTISDPSKIDVVEVSKSEQALVKPPENGIHFEEEIKDNESYAETANAKLIKGSPICNNNNDPPANIAQQKLATSESTTGA